MVYIWYPVYVYEQLRVPRGLMVNGRSTRTHRRSLQDDTAVYTVYIYDTSEPTRYVYAIGIV